MMVRSATITRADASRDVAGVLVMGIEVAVGEEAVAAFPHADLVEFLKIRASGRPEAAVSVKPIASTA